MGNISFSSARSNCPPQHFSLFLWLSYSMWVQLWVYVRTENMQQTHCFLKELGLLQLHSTGKFFARFKLPSEQLMQPVPSCSFISRAAERKGTSCVNLLNHVRKASCSQSPSFWIADISRFMLGQGVAVSLEDNSWEGAVHTGTIYLSWTLLPRRFLKRAAGGRP